MKINGLIFKIKIYEEKDKNIVWLLIFNEDTGILNPSAISIKNKKPIYKKLKYNQIKLVRWRITEKKKDKAQFSLSDIDTVTLSEKKEDIPVYILIKSKEFIPLWMRMWKQKVEPYNLTQNNGNIIKREKK